MASTRSREVARYQDIIASPPPDSGPESKERRGVKRYEHETRRDRGKGNEGLLIQKGGGMTGGRSVSSQLI